MKKLGHSKREVTPQLTLVQPNPIAIPEGFRFYDPELQNSANREPLDAGRYQQAKAKGKRLHRSYLRQLAPLCSRLNERTYARFSDYKQPLFDSNLLEFTFGDAIVGRVLVRSRWRPKTSAQAKFLSFDLKTIHILSYRRVDSLFVDVPRERWFDVGGRDIDSLLHDELTPVGRDRMQHRFLFASGTKLSLTFAEVSWVTKRLSPQVSYR